MLLLTIKIIHTLIWAINVAAILYVVYCGFKKKFNNLTKVSIIVVLLEGLALIPFRQCPLTVLMWGLVDNFQKGDDIFLPIWFIDYNIPVFAILFLIGLGMIGHNQYVKKRKDKVKR